MSSFRFPGSDDSSAELEAFPFPRPQPTPTRDPDILAGAEVFRALDDASRKIGDLARSLECFGFFDDDDGPRAA